MSEQFSNRWEEHAKTISEPAEQSKEGKRRIECGPATAEYLTAHLPDGRWAIRFACRMASSTSMTVPWRAFPSREEALDYFRQQATAFFKREGTLQQEQETAQKQIMGILEPNSLFGFEEPEPAPVTTPEPPPTPILCAEPPQETATEEPYPGGISPEGYARIAKEKNKRGLLCMLRDARKSLAHHGRRSWMGKQAKIEISAAEAELTRCNMPIPAEGQETAQWDDKPKSEG